MDHDIEKLKDFEKYLVEYSSSIFPPLKKKESIEKLLNIEFSDLQDLSAENCLSNAYELTSYAMFLQKEINENRAKCEWCENVIGWIISKEYNSYDPYMKYEIRKQSILNNNSFGESVEFIRSRLQARITLLDGQINDVRQMVRILESLAKRKAYDH